MAFINRKYPFRQRGGWLLIRESIIYGVVIWAILFLLQPFGFSQYQGNKFLVALMFGLVTTCCYALYGWLVLIKVVRRVNPWRVWHHGCAFIGLVLFIAVCNFLFFSYIFHYPLTLGFFFLFLYWTILLGVILTAASSATRRLNLSARFSAAAQAQRKSETSGGTSSLIFFSPQ